MPSFVSGTCLSRIALGAALVAAFAPAHAAITTKPGDRVDNFRLTDHRGDSHELHYFTNRKAIVLMAHGNGCATNDADIKVINQLRKLYKSDDVQFFGVNSNLNDSREAVVQSAKAAGIEMPIFMDDTQLIGESLNLTKTGEVLIVNPKNWTLAYRGNAASAMGALKAVTAGAPLTTESSPFEGCDIKMPEREKRAAHAKISYEKDIAPMLMDKCVACHRAGGIGPWAMTNYDLIRGFAPMIREVVRTQRMPPWHADPHYLAFSNDRSLTKEETQKLVHWIEAGAPRGTGKDPLLDQPKTWSEWALGTPDLIVKTKPFTVPATGTVPYQNIDVENPLDRDVWIRAIDYVPGQRAVLHHVIASAVSGKNRFGGASLNNYVPGADPLQIPADNGILLQKGSKFHFQMHFTTAGKEMTDVTQFGLYFMKEPPKYNYRALIFANPGLRIPAGAESHEVKAEQRVRKDSIIYSVHPHSHFRGKSAKFVAYLPDGSEKVLLNVPRYDFNWQATYDLKEPIMLPANTRIVYTTIFDNSTQNKANPDPNVEVRWGEQTWEEMVFGVIRYRQVVEDGTPNAPERPGESTDFTRIQAE
jgi:hypothetical protein